MSSRPRVVPPPDPESASAEFEVDSHGAESAHEEPTAPESTTTETSEQAIPQLVIGWTPEEATQLICAIWNFGMLVWGPEWAAHPAETAGWNISAAQLLDQFLPKGTGGYVELGAGLIMVGNGLAMMGVRRVPLIQRGPRPMWVRRRAPEAETEPGAPPPAPASRPAASNGRYKMPADLAPAPADPLNGLGL